MARIYGRKKAACFDEKVGDSVSQSFLLYEILASHYSLRFILTGLVPFHFSRSIPSILNRLSFAVPSSSFNRHFDNPTIQNGRRKDTRRQRAKAHGLGPFGFSAYWLNTYAHGIQINENLAELMNPEIVEAILAEGRNPRI